jgi:hypothetical protein
VSFVVTKGLGGSLLITEGYGNEEQTPETTSLWSMSEGGLTIDVANEGDVAVMTWKDTANNFSMNLPASASQLAGTDFMLLAFSVNNGTLSVYLNGVLVGTHSLSGDLSYGGTVGIMSAKKGTVFDHRFIDGALSQTSVQYYVNDVQQNSGNSTLPNA